MVDDDKPKFRDLLSTWDWGDPVYGSLDFQKLYDEMCMAGGDIVLQEVQREVVDHYGIWLEIKHGKFVVGLSLFDGEVEAERIIDDPVDELVLDRVESDDEGRSIVAMLRKLADDVEAKLNADYPAPHPPLSATAA